MNATKRSAARVGLALVTLLVVALTGCRTHVVHERTRTVYVPAPPPVVTPPPAPAPQPRPVVVVTPPEPAPVVVIQSENDFYEPLAAHGRWVVVGSYGRCWVPAHVEVGWRPYSNGYWQRTDAGWYWASEEPWGWATYHYGRWDFTAEFGWVWVPQTQWAPAWVAWREGGGYVGWAPLRPSVAIGVNVTRVDYEPAFASRAFVFVEHRRMLEPVRHKSVVVNNTTIINQTVNITNVKVVNKTVINEGPRPEVIERESGRKVRAVPAREFRHREETAVAARERNVPTARNRTVETPARFEPQREERKFVPPPVVQPVERPAQVVTQPPQPHVMPVRPASPRTEAGSPAREERNRRPEIGRQTMTPPPAVAPDSKPVVASPPQTVPTRNEVRPIEKPAVIARPTPPAVTARPVRDEKKREATIEKKVEAPVPGVESRTRRELRPETRRETKSPAKVEATPAATMKNQSTPPTNNPADKRLISPKEKSRATERGETDKKKQETDGSNKKGKGQEAEPAARGRPSR